MNKRTLTFLTALCFAVPPALACTIFMLTDNEKVLVGNNEDWSDPKTRIWFLDGKDGTFGRVFFGFDNFWGQGGMNDQGLFYDWVNFGAQTGWTADPDKKSIDGNPAEAMLASCATVEDAIEFFKTHNEPGFGYARIFVADRNGASVTIRFEDGSHRVDRGTDFQVMGYGHRVVMRKVEENHEATVENLTSILFAAKQDGEYPTQYSNIHDLKSLDVYIFDFRKGESFMKINLMRELEKGNHYYELPLTGEKLANPKTLGRDGKPGLWQRNFS